MTWHDGLNVEEKIRINQVLQSVKDPEIDSISILELGMVERAELQDGTLTLFLLPTFMGCPALDIIKTSILKAFTKVKEVKQMDVHFIYHPPWTSDRISEEGKLRLKEFGIAPPMKEAGTTGEWQAACPYCDSLYTTLDNLFGPTACRSILYCKSCKNPFEAMKPVSNWM
ncbi:phenylacetate-CoA oxygenase subunit PaaJ [Jeotgalibacillus sp. ET6]|uniref:1,2-phenylacetyl-CoA epoxidase subunit PaaD n=1 Tax=Jeotgalibacillus sp. ET6 TaxID=3037260 RepID=UPI0024187783|nr:1,2-phenylacetyl-CoA epoxidase subunit PaaD [Jeotgalibacillus sp. ET6]MDG5473039.1 phenylacetate-CoA oxygenase subunit PaaJ [Jeotgalibacillus sp. ET6]